ncbi:hypothetical protein BAE44_0020777 [Dichanthelium oligosanthes]|uniref:FBD domain-containing protein n=1 Tax=Dichanthelium oligosanthes TaxID=888268 RepID=A0A1E5UZ57_9POAL|nr:hypothetical protein BAE44_0020777 [Dichanthelium oligosanthes]
MGHLDCLKKVYMGGFRCYRGQIELLCGILQRSPALEHVTIEPKVTKNRDYRGDTVNSLIPAHRIHEWARRAAERYGKVISVVGEQVL